MEKYLPRLLFISDVTLNAESTGINRTLVNLLESYPANNFMLYAPDKDLKSLPTYPPLAENVAAFPSYFLPYLSNRLGFLFNPPLESLNFQLFQSLPLANRHQIDDFSPEVAVICPNGPLGLIAGYKVIKELNIPFLIYFMDNWVSSCNINWLSGNIQSICGFVLQQADGWLMISSQLEKDLSERYKVSPKRSLVVHNPVNLSNRPNPNFTPYLSGTFRVAYAGAIWSMHYDAIAVIAEAIYEMRNSGIDIELVLYTNEGFWESHKANWDSWQVRYGSFIQYEKLTEYLQQANLLLVASSFLPESAHIVSSSVQTKLTDYMASGQPILSCGPDYAICNDFVRNWNCGFVCETNKITETKALLLSIIQNPEKSLYLAENAYEVVKNNFEMGRVKSKLYNFINQTLSDKTNKVLQK
jgi:glycosyltransferase involved in cell wall biosynthesis